MSKDKKNIKEMSDRDLLIYFHGDLKEDLKNETKGIKNDIEGLSKSVKTMSDVVVIIEKDVKTLKKNDNKQDKKIEKHTKLISKHKFHLALILLFIFGQPIQTLASTQIVKPIVDKVASFVIKDTETK